MYRYLSTGSTQTGTFTSSESRIVQVWGDEVTTHYYLASRTKVLKFSFPEHDKAWEHDFGEVVGGASKYHSDVYVMLESGADVWVLDHMSGEQRRTFTLDSSTDDSFGTMYGSLVVADGVLYHGSYNDDAFYGSVKPRRSRERECVSVCVCVCV